MVHTSSALPELRQDPTLGSPRHYKVDITLTHLSTSYPPSPHKSPHRQCPQITSLSPATRVSHSRVSVYLVLRTVGDTEEIARPACVLSALLTAHRGRTRRSRLGPLYSL